MALPPGCLPVLPPAVMCGLRASISPHCAARCRYPQDTFPAAPAARAGQVARADSDAANAASRRAGVPPTPPASGARAREDPPWAGRRHHWHLAAQMAPTVTDCMLKGWFLQFCVEGADLPCCPRRRMLWLVDVRAGFRTGRDSLGVLMASAAIRREAMRLRHFRDTGRTHPPPRERGQM